MPAETCGEDVLPQGAVVAGVGVGAPEFVAHLGVESFAAPDFEPAADREGEAIEGTGIVVGGEIVFDAPECPACLAAQEDSASGIILQAEPNEIHAFACMKALLAQGMK